MKVQLNQSDQLERYQNQLDKIQQKINENTIKNDSELLINNIFYPFNLQIKVEQSIIQYEENRELEFLIQLFSNIPIKTHMIDILQIINAVFKKQQSVLSDNIMKATILFIYNNLVNVFLDQQLFILIVKIGQYAQFTYSQVDQQFIQNLVQKFVISITINQTSIIKYINSTISQLLYLIQDVLERENQLNHSISFIFQVLEQFVLQIFNNFTLTDIFMLAFVQKQGQSNLYFTFVEYIYQIVQQMQKIPQKDHQSQQNINVLSFQLQLIALIFVPTSNIANDANNKSIECLFQIKQVLGRYICGNTVENITNSININNIKFESWSNELQKKQQQFQDMLSSNQKINQSQNKKQDQIYICINMQLFLQLKNTVLHITGNQQNETQLNKFLILFYICKEIINQQVVQDKIDSQEDVLNVAEDSFAESQSLFQHIIAKFLQDYPQYYDIFGKNILFTFNFLTSLIDICNSDNLKVLLKLLEIIKQNYSFFNSQQILMDMGGIQKTQQNIVDQERIPIYLSQLEYEIIQQFNLQLFNISKHSSLSHDNYESQEQPSQSRLEVIEHKEINYDIIFNIIKCISTEQNKQQIQDIEWQFLCDIFEYGTNEMQLKYREKTNQYINDPRHHVIQLLSKQPFNLVNIQPGDTAGIALYFCKKSNIVLSALKLIRFDVANLYNMLTQLLQRNLVDDKFYQEIQYTAISLTQNALATPQKKQVQDIFMKYPSISIITPGVDLQQGMSNQLINCAINNSKTQNLLELPIGVSIQRYRAILVGAWIYGLLINKVFEQLEQFLTCVQVTSPGSNDSRDYKQSRDGDNEESKGSDPPDICSAKQIITWMLYCANSSKQTKQQRAFHLFGTGMSFNSIQILKNVLYYIMTQTKIILHAYLQTRQIVDCQLNQPSKSNLKLSSVSLYNQQSQHYRNQNIKDMNILEKYAVAAIQNTYTLLNIVNECGNERCGVQAEVLRWSLRDWEEIQVIPQSYGLISYLNIQKQNQINQTTSEYRKQVIKAWNRAGGVVNLVLMHYQDESFRNELNNQVQKIRASGYTHPKNLYRDQQSQANQSSNSAGLTTPSHRQMAKLLSPNAKSASRESNPQNTFSARNIKIENSRTKSIQDEFDVIDGDDGEITGNFLENTNCKVQTETEKMLAMLFFTDNVNILIFYDIIMQYVEYFDILLFILLDVAISSMLDEVQVSIFKLTLTHICQQFKQQNNKYLKIKINYRMLFTNQFYKLLVEIIKIYTDKFTEQKDTIEIQQLIMESEKFQLQYYEPHFLQYITINIMNILKYYDQDSHVKLICQYLKQFSQLKVQKTQFSQINSTLLQQYMHCQKIISQTQQQKQQMNQSQVDKIYHKLTVLVHNEQIYQGSFQNFQYDVQQYLNNQIELPQLYHKYFKNAGKPLFMYDMKAFPQLNGNFHINQQRKFIDMLVLYFTTLGFQFQNVIDNTPQKPSNPNTSPLVFHLNEYLLEFKGMFETIPTSDQLYYDISIVILSFYTVIAKQIMVQGYLKDICYNFQKSFLQEGAVKKFMQLLSGNKYPFKYQYIYVQQLYNEVITVNLVKGGKQSEQAQLQLQNCSDVYMHNLINISNNGFKTPINIGYSFKQCNVENCKNKLITSQQDVEKTQQTLSLEQIFISGQSGFTIYSSSFNNKIDLGKHSINIQLSLLPLYLQTILTDYDQIIKIQFMIDSYFVINDKIGYLAEREQKISAENKQHNCQLFQKLLQQSYQDISSSAQKETQIELQNGDVELTRKNNYCVILYILKKLKQFRINQNHNINHQINNDVIFRLKLINDTLQVHGLQMELFNDNTLIDHLTMLVDTNYYYYFINKLYSLFIRIDQLFIQVAPFIKQQRYTQILDGSIYDNIF